MAKAKKFVMKNPFVHHGARVFQNKFKKYITKKKNDENRLKQIALRTKSYKSNKAAVARFKRKAQEEKMLVPKHVIDLTK